MEEKVHIVHQVLVEHQMQSEVAKEHRILSSRVSSLVRKAQKNKNFLRELAEVERQ